METQSRTAPAAHLVCVAKRQYRNFVHVFAALFVVLTAMVTITTSAAEAATVRWTIAGTFEDGGTANGYFDYDTVGQSLLGWNITMAGGDTATFPETTLASTDVGAIGTLAIHAASFTSFPSFLGIFPVFGTFPPPPTDTLFSLLSDPFTPILVLLQQCQFICLPGVLPERLGSGVLTGEALAETPLPAALPLFATVIGLGAVLARRRKRQTAI